MNKSINYEDWESGLNKNAYLYQLGEPVLGTYPFSPMILEKNVNQFLLEIKENKSKFNLIFAKKIYEPALVFFLLRLSYKLKSEGKKVVIVTPLTFSQLENVSAEYILLHKAETMPNLEQFLLKSNPETVIATTIDEFFCEKLVPFAPLIFRLPIFKEDVYRMEGALQKEEKVLEQITKKQMQVYKLVSFVHSLGVVFPFPLLAKTIKTVEDTLEELLNAAEEVFYWIEREVPPELFIGVKGEYPASFFAKMFEDEFKGLCKDSIISADCMNKTHRNFILQLLFRFSHKYKMQTKLILKEIDNNIQKFIKEGDSKEKLIWSKIYNSVYSYTYGYNLLVSALEKDKDNVFLMHALANNLSAIGKFKEAEKYFEKMPSLQPYNVYIYQTWAEMESKRNYRHWSKARSLFEEALRINPHNIYTFTSFASFEIKTGNLNKAKELLDLAFNQDIENCYLLSSLAILEKTQLNYSKAIEHLKTALKYEPLNTVVLNIWATISKERGHLKKAEKIYRRILKHDPCNLPSMHGLAEVLAEKKNYVEAKEIFELILKLYPENLYAHISLSMVALKQKNILLAKKHLKVAGDIDDRNPVFLTCLANIYSSEKRYNKAETIFEEVLDIVGKNESESIPVYNSMAKMFSDKKEFEKSRECIKKSLKIIKRREFKGIEQIITLNSLADIEFQEKRYKEMIDLYEKSLTFDKNNAYTNYDFGSVLEKIIPFMKNDNNCRLAQINGSMDLHHKNRYFVFAYRFPLPSMGKDDSPMLKKAKKHLRKARYLGLDIPALNNLSDS